MSGPVGVEKFTPVFVQPFIGVGAKVVPLGLEQVRRELFATIAVKIGKGAG
jgi:hypothetical protein